MSGPLQSSPAQINSPSNPRLDPIDSKSSLYVSPDALTSLCSRTALRWRQWKVRSVCGNFTSPAPHSYPSGLRSNEIEGFVRFNWSMLHFGALLKFTFCQFFIVKIESSQNIGNNVVTKDSTGGGCGWECQEPCWGSSESTCQFKLSQFKTRTVYNKKCKAKCWCSRVSCVKSCL